MQRAGAYRNTLLFVAVAALGAAAGCDSGDRIIIGVDAPTTVYVSPTGSDADPGTADRPWQTFAFALGRLSPGSTLVLKDGSYTPGTTGLPDVRCGAGAGAANGTPDAPITLVAEHERAALLDSDGRAPALFMQGCSHWIVDGLRGRSVDNQTTSTLTEAGSIFALGADNHWITLRRLLASHPNRFRHAHGVRVGEGSSDVTVEECEVYDYHQNAFETVRTTGVVFRRNYCHSRAAADVPGGYTTEEPTRGDVGILFEETRFGLAENNVVESSQTGIRVMGRSLAVPSTLPALAPDPVTDNRVLGNMVLDSTDSGYRIDSRCMGQAPCVEATRMVVNTQLIDDVAVGGLAGVAGSGALHTRISQLTALHADVGVAVAVESANAGLASDTFVTNVLVTGYKTAGFRNSGERSWGFDHCAAFGGSGPAFTPMDDHVVGAITADPALGDCVVTLPAGSPLRHAGAGGADVGANVTFRYQAGLPTTTRLWDQTTGAFPCGAVVATVNDDPAQSCIGVHQRLHVGAAAGCALP